MNTSAVSGSQAQIYAGPTNLAAIGATRRSGRGDGDGDHGSEGGAAVAAGGSTLFNSLLQALTQAAGLSPPTAAGPNPTTTTTSPPTSTSTVAVTVGTTTPTDSTTTTGTTTSSTATVGSTTTSTGATTPVTTGTIANDLRAFLHDLFRALRVAGKLADDDGNGSAGSAAASTSSVASTNAATTIVTPVTTGSTAGSSSTLVASASSTPTVTATSTVAGKAAYGEHSLASNLQALLQDLAAGTGGSVRFDRAASHLNQAFTKLIGDLRSLATTNATTSTGTGKSASASLSGRSGIGSNGASDTAALQSFLSAVLSGLQQNGGTPSPLGNVINTTA